MANNELTVKFFFNSFTAKLYNNLRVIERVALKMFVSDDKTKIVDNCLLEVHNVYVN